MLSRRGLGKVAAGAVGLGQMPRRPDQYYEPGHGALGAGSRSGNIRTHLVVIFGSGASQGLFVYQGTPAAGNLIASIAAFTTVDQFGNDVLAGVMSYTPTAGAAVDMQGGAVQFFTGPIGGGGPWTPQGQIAVQSNGDLLLQGTLLTAITLPAASGTPASLAHADFSIASGSKGLRVSEAGAGPRLGTATLVGGTVTVPCTTVTVSTRVLYARSVAGGTLGHLSRTINAGVSFTINSSSNLDTSQIAWMLVEPA